MNIQRIYLRKLPREYPYDDISGIPPAILRSIEGGYSILPGEFRQDLRGGSTEADVQLN